jgi:DNA-binding transcriptional LysR family regulator
MESLSGIEAFVQVVETGSFTAAASRLQTAKSSVSDSVRALEERLGVRLLERTTRHVRPNDAGRLFYTRCRRLLDEADTARTEVRAFQTAPTGRLRLAVPENFGDRYILPGLPGFLAAFPTVRVEVISAARHTPGWSRRNSTLPSESSRRPRRLSWSVASAASASSSLRRRAI